MDSPATAVSTLSLHDALPISNTVPIGHACSAQGINADVEVRAANGLQVNNSIKTVDVSGCIVMPVSASRLQRSCQCDSADFAEPARQQSICPRGNPACDGGIGRAAVRRVVLEAAVFGRIVR